MRILHGLARILSPGALQDAFAAAALGKAVFQPGTVRRALRYADALGFRGVRRWRLALDLLANRGRDMAFRALRAMLTPEEFRRQVVVQGLDHLGGPIRAPAAPGRIFVVFHFGPYVIADTLRALGYGHTVLRKAWSANWIPPPRPEWQTLPPVRDLNFGEDPAARTAALTHLRRLILAGENVFIAADGSIGPARDALRIALLGGDLEIKSGWWTLRRLTRAPAFPILCHRDGRRAVVDIRPPLPPPLADSDADLAFCGQVLESIVREYVRAHPDQCQRLAFTAPPPRNTGARGTQDEGRRRSTGGRQAGST